jgi:hypothetical protein
MHDSRFLNFCRLLLIKFGVSLVVSIGLRNSVVSFRYEGRFLTCGCNHLSTNWDMGSVILLQLDTIGLIPMGFLWIFFKKKSLDVRVCLGGLQNSNHVCFKNSFFFSASSFSIIFSFSMGVISSRRGLYTLASF